jgi:nucleoside-diphosphate-sugar epimerase
MRILLVGATSSLARVLRPLLAQFAEVVTAGREGADMKLDLQGEFIIDRGFDAVINLAASVGGSDSVSMIEAEQINVLGLLKLCMACDESSVGQLVQVSSIFAELTPDSPFFNFYALSKRHADEVALLYSATYDLPITVVRPSQFYGTGEGYRRSQPFLYHLMDRAEANQDIVIYGTNDALRNIIHVDDVAHVISLVVQRRILGIYSCTYPENVRYSEIARAAIEAFNSTSRLSFAADRPDIPDNAFAPADALYKAIGFTPTTSLVMGMRMEAEQRKLS